MIVIVTAVAVSLYIDGRKKVAGIGLEKAKVEREYVLQERDLNNNGSPERFYEIDGKRVFLSIDGKNLEDTLRE